MLQILFSNAIRVTVTTSVILTILLVLMPFIRKKYSAKWRYWVWLLVAVRLIIPFSPTLPQMPFQIISPLSQNLSLKPSVPAEAPAAPSPASAAVIVPQPEKTTSAAPVHTVSPGGVLSVVWVLGIALFLLYHLTGFLLFKKNVLRFSKPIENPHTIELWNNVKETMCVRKNIGLLSVKKAMSPMMTGFFIPLLLLPEVEYSERELSIILKHELIHYKRKDIWYKLLLMCANAIHWFNPLIYIMSTLSNKDIEMVCDSEAVKNSDMAFRKQYSETILSAISKEKQRQLVFSTYFTGGKKTMAERFGNIFDMENKRRGIAALLVVLLALDIAGSSAAYGTNEKKMTSTIHNLSLLNAGNSYERENGKFIIVYRNGLSTAEVPLRDTQQKNTTFFKDKAVYISEEITAVAYGGANRDNPVKVLVTRDMGKTWNNYPVSTAGTNGVTSKFIGFASSNDGWLVTSENGPAGTCRNRIFETSDGGKTWTEIGNTNTICTQSVTGAGFIDDTTGFLSFRDDSSLTPCLYRTDNTGKTWSKVSLPVLTETLKNIASYATALSPVFDGDNGILPVALHNNQNKSDPYETQIQYTTSDGGKTWNLDEKYNLALIWANAWMTRDGRPRYAMMNKEMQANFRANQYTPDNFVIRWSSPWVTSYDVAINGDQAVITYFYTDSTSDTYRGTERLSFGKENGKTVVTQSKTEIEMEEYADTSTWKTATAGGYSFSMPNEWTAKTFPDGSISFMRNAVQLGSLQKLSYDPSRPLSQFEGNHAQTLSTQKLDGAKYPATQVVIRRTQPAASGDDSYSDELHIYLIPENNRVAYDLNFDTSWGSAKAIALAKTLTVSSADHK